MTYHFRSPGIGVDRYAKSTAKDLEAGDMVVVFMRNENAVKARGIDAGRFESHRNLSRAEPGINEDPAPVCGD
jgi:hypothetical protein